MQDSTTKARHRSRLCSASYPLSATTVRIRAMTAKAARNRRSKTTVSLTLAAVAAHATGMPSALTAMWSLVPRLPRSVGLEPVRSPAHLARTEQVSRMSLGSPRRMAISRVCTCPAGPCAPSVREHGAASSRWPCPRSPSGFATVCRRAGIDAGWRPRVSWPRAGGPAHAQVACRSTRSPLRPYPRTWCPTPSPCPQTPDMGTSIAGLVVRSVQPRVDVATAS